MECPGIIRVVIVKTKILFIIFLKLIITYLYGYCGYIRPLAVSSISLTLKWVNLKGLSVLFPMYLELLTSPSMTLLGTLNNLFNLIF